ncbi:MAG: sigma 54-interacting transcriptional regulator [Spirochaetaceae bacterium]|jgi:Nif-specific regulatory protein|nr:sigma 54-interacting transcriptional regulator [Spirochaetaceae bacterium]
MLSRIDIHKFNALIEINTLINSNYGNSQRLLTHILESAARLCDGDAASILLVEKETKSLYFAVALGAKGAEVQRFTLKIGEGIAGWVAAHNESVIINDVEHDTRHFHQIPKQIDYSTKTMMAVPMRVNNECVGVIELINKKNGQYFVQEDLEWLEILANQAAMALINAQNIEKAHLKIRLLRDRIQDGKGYHTLIAKSPAIVEKLEIIDRIAQTDSSVLILGESGVGKELFAEQIHLRSRRKSRPLIRVNCAALPEGLLESELFGHVKGAFTGAGSERQGRFEAANGGTIFLDEIGDFPLLLQAKLLRVIQHKTFEKVGSDLSVTVDVRILAATNKQIEELVAQGTFRSDLYYRLNVLPLYIPPLRQRPEDIPELAMFFLKRCMRETKKRFKGFSSEAMHAMLSYGWPGNIRELENCVERACVIGKRQWIQEEDLLLNQNSAGPVEKQGSRNLKNALAAFKAYFIKKVLAEHNGNKTEAAKALGIQRTYLSKLIKELFIINPKE